ncbi:hypothetical protein PpBr36_09122 [Pyricularia pennisetigena]|uniref:hypothetical protein n=1 Tax=Pyricularia pennisetigena TaxID=1578925 RepID=UPI001152AEDD|nr:hypothetical protein PpBr36_09122 [Pyricularia pennisetigena]TLS24098.1 hypothetical protein PpBr36_09122 [Pyricularia pennisetigena]
MPLKDQSKKKPFQDYSRYLVIVTSQSKEIFPANWPPSIRARLARRIKHGLDMANLERLLLSRGQEECNLHRVLDLPAVHAELRQTVVLLVREVAGPAGAHDELLPQNALGGLAELRVVQNEMDPAFEGRVNRVCSVAGHDKEAGIGSNLAFGLGLVVSGAQTIMVMASWVLTTYLGRRTIYLWGSAINMVFLIAVGIAGSFGKSYSTSMATASLGLIVSVLFCLGPAPASWVIIGETSSIRLRPLTTGVGRASYYIVNIPCIYLSSWMLNTEGANLAGRTGYVWAATAAVCLAAAYVWLPEMKHRSYREIDILFNRHVPARKWKKTVIDIHDDE